MEKYGVKIKEIHVRKSTTAACVSRVWLNQNLSGTPNVWWYKPYSAPQLNRLKVVVSKSTFVTPINTDTTTNIN